MFEVLVYVYENYWEGNACPELEQLGRKLTAVGFEADEIHEALVWLYGLNIAAQSTQICFPESGETSQQTDSEPTAQAIRTQSASSMRVYSIIEQEYLG